MEAPKLLVNLVEYELPHHQGYKHDQTIIKNTTDTCGGYTTIDYIAKKYYIAINYDAVHKDTYELLANLVAFSVTAGYNSPIYFKYEKVPKYEQYVNVQAELSGVDFVKGEGVDDYYYAFTLTLTDISPR